jgi:hypothetical protein
MGEIQGSLSPGNSCIGGTSNNQPMLFLSIGTGNIPMHRLYWGSTVVFGMLLQAASFGPLLGHGGQNCPWHDALQAAQGHTGSGMDPEDVEDDWEDETAVPMDDQPEEVPPFDKVSGISRTHLEGQSLWGPAVPGTHRIVMVTSTRIFRCQIRWCHFPHTFQSNIPN